MSTSLTVALTTTKFNLNFKPQGNCDVRKLHVSPYRIDSLKFEMSECVKFNPSQQCNRIKPIFVLPEILIQT